MAEQWATVFAIPRQWDRFQGGIFMMLSYQGGGHRIPQNTGPEAYELDSNAFTKWVSLEPKPTPLGLAVSLLARNVPAAFPNIQDG